MLVSFRWLNDYVEIRESPGEIADLLTRQGLEVASLTPAAPDLDRVVAGRVAALEPHPHQAGLWVCRIDAGGPERTVVCGAENVRKGDVVPLALPGAALPGGKGIQAASIHGVLSEGMLCSERELGLSEDAAGVLQLPSETKPGEAVGRIPLLNDHVLEVELTPNRPDCLCVIGVAREIAAKKGRGLRVPRVHLAEEDGDPVGNVTSVEILAPEACHRYVARVLEGVTVGPSPFWLRRRLSLVGFRPVNNIVDVTNYVLLERGQPLHAFDLDRLEGRRIRVRMAVQGERLITLDGKERVLDDRDLLICDARNPVALAGVMGGLESEIQPSTRRVLLESAFFEPRGIRRTSKRHGLSTEASYRFEREIDKEGARRAADRAAGFIRELGGGRVLAGAVDRYPNPFRPREIPLDVERVNGLLGTVLSETEVVQSLASVEVDVRGGADGGLVAVPPPFRPDIRLPEDLVEEVARLVGYDAIPTEMPRAPLSVLPPDPERAAEEKARDLLVGMGFHETIHFSFHGRDRLAALGLSAAGVLGDPVALQNPLSEAQAVLRTTLLASLLDTVSRNQRRNNRDLRLFELRRVFLRSAGGPLPAERKRLAAVLAGGRYPRQWNQPRDGVDLFDLKGVLDLLAASFGIGPLRIAPGAEAPFLHPGFSGSVLLAADTVGVAGKLHPDAADAFDIAGDVFVFELDFSPFAAGALRSAAYRPFVRNPSVQRDIALVLDQDVTYARVADRIRALVDPRVTDLYLFDLYQGPQLPQGKKSMAFRITYQDPERTLTDEEVNGLQEDLLRRLLPEFGAHLR